MTLPFVFLINCLINSDTDVLLQLLSQLQLLTGGQDYQHRPLEGQVRNGVTRAQSRNLGGVVPPRLGVSLFTILSRFFVMLVFLFCKLFEHYSQTNFPIIKTKDLFKVTKYLKVWQIFRPKWVKIKVFVIVRLPADSLSAQPSAFHKRSSSSQVNGLLYLSPHQSLEFKTGVRLGIVTFKCNSL